MQINYTKFDKAIGYNYKNWLKSLGNIINALVD